MPHALPTATIVALALSLCMPGRADAATIDRYSDPVMGCTMLLSGPIVEGDSERLWQFLERENPVGPGGSPKRLCLNSPGGSYREGVRLAQLIIGSVGIGTAIAQGHRCESACAIVFMAAGSTSGSLEEAWPIRPIMHPQARLGFHAPSIEIPSGQYSEQQVTQAWNVALQAIAEIVNLRSREVLGLVNYYEFHERLLYHMLVTPPDSMYYIDTVEKAAKYGISVYPVGINSAQPLAALFNLCNNSSIANGGVMVVYSEHHMPRIRFVGPDALEANYESGFGMEGAGGCSLSLSLETLFSERDALLAGEFVHPHSGTYIMSFDPSTRLDQLPTDIEGTWREFISRLRASAAPAVPAFGSCWLTSPTARIVNVNEYANLRRQPDFAATVLRRLPLGEQVRVPRFDNITIVGQDRDRQSCINACQAFDRNPRDRAARDIVQQCINDNMIWYEITDARGNRGWVSRRFLQEVE